MHKLFDIAFELHDWKSQPTWMKVASVIAVAAILFNLA